MARVMLTAAALLGLCVGCTQVAPVEQPMGFSHKRHAEADVDCLTCHEGASDAPAAGLPRLRVCAKCHKELQGQDPEEPKIVAAVTAKQEVPWVQVNWLPGHVYFSHRAHVDFAKLECDACHGALRAVDRPLRTPDAARLSMAQCMDCHARRGAANECATCHR